MLIIVARKQKRKSHVYTEKIAGKHIIDNFVWIYIVYCLVYLSTNKKHYKH